MEHEAKRAVHAADPSQKKRKRQRPYDLWRLIMKNSQVNRPLHPPALLLDWPPTLIGDQSSGAALRHNLRLFIVGQSFGVALRSVSNFRWRPAIRPIRAVSLRLASPGQPFGPAIRPARGFRRLPILRRCPWTNLRLASGVASPAPPLRQPSACAADRPSGCAFRWSPTVAGYQPSGFAFASATDSHRRSTLRLCPRTNFRRTARSSVEEKLGVTCLWMQVQIVRFLWISQVDSPPCCQMRHSSCSLRSGIRPAPSAARERRPD